MKKKVVWISACIAAVLCLTTSIGLAFAITPQDALNDAIRNSSEKATSVSYGIENTDGTNPSDFVSAYIYENVQKVFPGMQLGASSSVEDAQVSDISDHPAATSDVQDSVSSNSTGLDTSAVSENTSSAASSSQTQTVELEKHNCTLIIGGNAIPYIDSYQTSTAPANSAGIWLGKDAVDDGTWAYFIGHNPGVFTCVASLSNGDAVTVWDSNGNSRTYHVVKEFDVASGTNWSQVQNDVTQYGESIILQTCIDGGSEYRIVVAA